MQQYSLKLTCLDHSRPILLFLLRPYTLNPNTENVKSLQFCCDDCLMKIPSSDRTGLHCLPLKDINIFFRSLINHSNSMILPQFDHTANMIEENNLYTYLIELFKRNFLVSPKDPLPCSEDSLILGLQNLVKPFQQKLILGNVEKLTAGEADFSFESCTYVPDKEYIFVGNRSGELFVIKKGSKEIVKKIVCTGRIGAVKYIPEKKIVVVSGLHKYIMKIDVDTLEIMTPSQPSQTTDYKNFIVIEYLKHQDLLLVGGFNVEHSIELYNFNDLSLVKTLTYQYAARRLPDELWISLSIDSLDTILLGYKSGNLQVWKSKEFQLVHSFHTFDHIYALEYQSDQKLVYTGHLNGVIQIWQMKRGRFYRTKYTNIGDSPINKMRFLPTSCPKYLLISNFTHKLSIWTHLGQKVDEIEIFKEPSRAILVLDDNTIVSAGATAGIIYFIEPKLAETKRKEVEKNKQRPVRLPLKDNNWTGNTLQQTSLG